MNSRIEGGEMSLSSKKRIIDEIKQWCGKENIELDDDTKAYFFDHIEDAKPESADSYISYMDGTDYFERKIFFPESDSADRIRNMIAYDDKVKEYLDIDAVADFIYNCIDVNAVSSVQCVALLYDDEDSYNTKGRNELMDIASDGCDEYAYEICDEALGMTWVERSAVVINISNLLDSTQELYDEGLIDNINDEFRRAFVQTMCHEFRHAVYDINEFTPKDGSDPRYPLLGGEEDAVEDYGNEEAEKLRRNPEANKYITRMFDINSKEKEKKQMIER